MAQLLPAALATVASRMTSSCFSGFIHLASHKSAPLAFGKYFAGPLDGWDAGAVRDQEDLLHHAAGRTNSTVSALCTGEVCLHKRMVFAPAAYFSN